MTELPEYVLERTFDAPIDLVWSAWTDPNLLAKWYGPNIETVIHEFDFNPGGQWLNEMIWGGNSNYSKMVFQTIEPPSLLVWNHHSCTDANWNDIDNPMMPGWPRLLLTTVTFSSIGTTCRVRLSQAPVDATDAEIECFRGAMSKMDGGWGSGFTVLADMLEEMMRTS